MTTGVGVIAPDIKVAGSTLASLFGDLLIGIKIQRGIAVPGRAVLRFADDGFTVASSGPFRIGTKVSIGTVTGTVLFAGEVTGVDIEMTFGAPELSVVIDDPGYKLALGNTVKTYTKMSYSDIVKQIAGAHGLRVDVTATSTTFDYLIQADSDYGFIGEIARRIGYDWWVDETGTLVFCPAGAKATAAPKVDWLTGLLSFSVRATALHPGTATIKGWTPANKQPVVANSTPSSVKADADLVAPFLAASNLSGSNAVVSSFDSFRQPADGKDLANRTVARWAAGAVTASGVCVLNTEIMVGGKVQVGDAGPASGTYFVTEVEHVYDTRGLTTRFTAGDRQPTRIVDTLAAAVPSSFRRDGLMIGLVTSLGGQGDAPAGHVKVKFPALGDQVESEWARVVSVGGGSSRGMTFLPEVNDEVIVGFEGGDVTRPVVIGGLYNGRDNALDFGTQDGKVTKRQIVSRLGHVVELGDGTAPADQHIGLTLAGGEHQVHLGKDNLTAKVPAGIPVSIKSGDHGIDIDNQGNITMSGMKITIKATQDVEISGLNVTLKANVKLAGSGTQVQMQGTAQAELSSSGQTAVKGSIVMIN